MSAEKELVFLIELVGLVEKDVELEFLANICGSVQNKGEDRNTHQTILVKTTKESTLGRVLKNQNVYNYYRFN